MAYVLHCMVTAAICMVYGSIRLLLPFGLLVGSCQEVFSLLNCSPFICRSRRRTNWKASAGNDEGNVVHEGRKVLTRRQVLLEISPALLVFAAAVPTMADDSVEGENPTPQSMTVPLLFNGAELLIYYRVDGSLFRAVVDTGSPFLLVPGSCGTNTKSKSGCYRQQGAPSGLLDTYEQFDGFEGAVEWRMAPISLAGSSGFLPTKTPNITFGVASESILGGPGGVFFGLIRDTDGWIRPSFLGQTYVQAIQLDLRRSNKTLTLSERPLISDDEDCIQLNTDLRRKYGAPVTHYTAKAHSITVNGYTLAEDGPGRKPIYVIFDTGVTGMTVSQDLFNERYVTARQRREKNLWGQVDISFPTIHGRTVTLSASKPITTPFDPQRTWTKFRGHLIVMGLSFLDGNGITIDIDQKRLLLESNNTLA